MDPDFKTSFIPKKPLAEEPAAVVSHARGKSLVSLVATIIFFATLASAGAVYLYKATLTTQVAELSASLVRARQAFEPSLVEILQTLDKRLIAAKEVLANHVTASPILRSLEELTLKSVRYTKFEYKIGDDGKTVKVAMTGVARSYTSVALQSDMLGRNKYIQDVVFSNLQLDSAGNVGFNLAFNVDPAFLSFANVASGASSITTQ